MKIVEQDIQGPATCTVKRMDLGGLEKTAIYEIGQRWAYIYLTACSV